MPLDGGGRETASHTKKANLLCMMTVVIIIVDRIAADYAAAIYRISGTPHLDCPLKMKKKEKQR